jgi:polyhydroxyalkanoate synthesis regulator phasin
MTVTTQMVEQHILESESGRKHVDELLARARQRPGEGPEHADVWGQLDALTKEHGRLGDQLEEFKKRNIDDWREEEIEQAGPMGIWDALAEDAEKLVEKLEKK